MLDDGSTGAGAHGLGRADDDDLPEALPQPNPGAWFELFCCATLIGAFVLGLVVLALLR